VLIEIGIAIEIEIGAVGETFYIDPDFDLDWACSCCTAKT
jgi:hypothetical protein